MSDAKRREQMVTEFLAMVVEEAVVFATTVRDEDCEPIAWEKPTEEVMDEFLERWLEHRKLVRAAAAKMKEERDAISADNEGGRGDPR